MNREQNVLALYQAQLNRIRVVFEAVNTSTDWRDCGGQPPQWDALESAIADTQADTVARAFQSPPTRHIDLDE